MRVSGTDCRFTADGQRLLSWDGRSVREYELATGSATRTWRAQFDEPDGDAGWSPSSDGRRVAVWANSGECVLIDVDLDQQSRLGYLDTNPLSRALPPQFTPQNQSIVHVRPRTNDSPIALCAFDGSTGGRQLAELDERPTDVRTAPQGNDVAVIGSLGDSLAVQFSDVMGDRPSRRDVFRGDHWGLRRGFSLDGSMFAADLAAPGYTTLAESAVFVWDVASGKTMVRIPNCWFEGWRADGRLVLRKVNPEASDVVYDPRTGSEVLLSPQPGNGGVEMDRRGRVLVTDKARTWPSFVVSVLDWLGRSEANYQWSVLVCRDLDGNELAELAASYQYTAELSPDRSLLAVQSRLGENSIEVYELPPRRPGGLVLAALIGQVGLFTSWTVWQRVPRRRCVEL
jgi:hypothetical protein